jgi:hypothetical protein
MKTAISPARPWAGNRDGHNVWGVTILAEIGNYRDFSPQKKTRNQGAELSPPSTNLPTPSEPERSRSRVLGNFGGS